MYEPRHPQGQGIEWLRRQALFALGIAAAVGALSSPLIYYVYAATQRCQAAQAAIEPRHWAEAQRELRKVAKLAVLYPRIRRLQCESHSHAGAEALEAGDWEAASMN